MAITFSGEFNTNIYISNHVQKKESVGRIADLAALHSDCTEMSRSFQACQSISPTDREPHSPTFIN
jgi:hypothetical protein